MKLGKLHLLVGPVGAGKSTYARNRMSVEGGVFLDLDVWMVRLYGGDARPAENVLAWYLERRERCRSLLWDTSIEILRTGSDVFLEPGLVSLAERSALYTKTLDEELPLTVYFIDAPRDVRRDRVLRRNETANQHTQVVPLEFFERASDAWEPPNETERHAVEMVDV